MTASTPKLLRANLTTGALQEEVIPQKIVVDFVGGRGFGVKYLYQELSPGIAPLSPDNKLIFSIGPLAGTGALSFSRWMAITKSPLTETYFRSVGGGDFGAWLRFAGLDMIIVEGKSTNPVYLYIEDGHYEIKDAGELWGEDTAKTQEKLKEIHGARVRTACIGPAGEKLVRYASILSDRRAAGRGGVGAVMGSKNLKAIVIKTARKVTLPNPDEFKELTPGPHKYEAHIVKAILSSSPAGLPDGDVLWVRSWTGVLYPQPWVIKITGEVGETMAGMPHGETLGTEK